MQSTESHGATVTVRLINLVRYIALELEDAKDDQWERPPRPRNDDLRATGGINRPTEDTALDERRQALRDAVVDAELALETAYRKLLRAHEEWRGRE